MPSRKYFYYAGTNKVFLKGPNSKIKGFVDHKVSMATTL